MWCDFFEVEKAKDLGSTQGWWHNIIESRNVVASLWENMNCPNKKVGRSFFFDQLGLFPMGAFVF
jgi:hypothetical protein